MDRRGTENVKVAAIQYAFREEANDEYAGNKSVFGTSPANIVSIPMDYFVRLYFYIVIQRIEGFWSVLRKHKTQ